MNENEQFYWLVGLLEGEGSFFVSNSGGVRAPTPKISIQMTDEEPIRHVAEMWGVKYGEYPPYGKNRKGTYSVTLCGSKSIPWMKRLKPYMSLRRQKQIDRCIEAESLRPGKLKGEAHPHSKLKWGEVWNIRRMLECNLVPRKIASAFNVSRSTIALIRIRKIWKHVP